MGKFTATVKRFLKVMKDKNAAQTTGLSQTDTERIAAFLNRQPNTNELKVYATIWTENISHKKTQELLRALPTEGLHIIEPLSGNLPVVDIGNYACVFNIETHDYPATSSVPVLKFLNPGIFTYGARPVAQLKLIFPGQLNKMKALSFLHGLLQGIEDFSQVLELSNISGKAFFHKSFNSLPFINVMSVGLISREHLKQQKTENQSGKSILIAGLCTGKEPAENKKQYQSGYRSEDVPSFHVNAYQEHLMLKAVSELVAKQQPAGMVALSKGGIVGGAAQLAAKGKIGMDFFLDEIPVKQKQLEVHEILLADSKERLLIIADEAQEKAIEHIFSQYDLKCHRIGRTTTGTELRFFEQNTLKAAFPVDLLTKDRLIPDEDLPMKEPESYKQRLNFAIEQIPQTHHLKAVAWQLLENPNIVGKVWNYHRENPNGTKIQLQYLTDASVVKLDDNSGQSLLVTHTCNPRYMVTDPQKGAAITVAEAVRNIVCTGGEPLAVAVSMNFDHLEKPEVAWQLAQTVEGISRICEKYDLPVINTNTHFVENLPDKQQLSTLTVGMLGIVKEDRCLTTIPFKQKGDMIFLLGETHNNLASSEYLASVHGIEEAPAPYFDLPFAFQLQNILQALIRKGLIHSAHDVSVGGLFITLVECGIPNGLGFDITSDAENREDAFLFGEAQNRIVVSVENDKETGFIDYMIENDFPFLTLGHVTKGEMRVDDKSYGFIKDAQKKYEAALRKLFK